VIRDVTGKDAYELVALIEKTTTLTNPTGPYGDSL
jgi:hypothetical protein